jgi:hypothetical protein
VLVGEHLVGHLRPFGHDFLIQVDENAVGIDHNITFPVPSTGKERHRQKQQKYYAKTFSRHNGRAKIGKSIVKTAVFDSK